MQRQVSQTNGEGLPENSEPKDDENLDLRPEETEGDSKKLLFMEIGHHV